MKISEVIAALTAISDEHGDIHVSTGGPEGDVVNHVWYDNPVVPVAYVG